MPLSKRVVISLDLNKLSSIPSKTEKKNKFTEHTNNDKIITYSVTECKRLSISLAFKCYSHQTLPTEHKTDT